MMDLKYEAQMEVSNWTIEEIEKYLEEHKQKKSKHCKYLTIKKRSLLKLCSRIKKFVKKIPNRWKVKKTGVKYEPFLTEEEKM